MSTPEQIVETARSCGDRRSPEYWHGALDALRFRLDGVRIVCPYQAGTAQFDAYFAGNDRGHALWRSRARGVATTATTSAKSRCIDRCTEDGRNDLENPKQDKGSHEIRRD